MSVRSYTKIWLHLIWGTYNHEKYLPDRNIRKRLSAYFYEYSKSRDIYMKANFVNSDHVHALIDMPTNISIENLLRLYKGSSSNWINKKVDYKFGWSKGYAALSVSESILDKVVRYILNQEEHHQKLNFVEEYERLLKKYRIIKNR